MKINIKHQTGKNSYGSIAIKFYIRREKTHIPTKVECYLKDWDSEKCRVKTSDKFSDDKNLIIDKTLARINDVFVKYRLRNRTLTRSLFYKAYHKPDDFDSFHTFVFEQIKKERKKLEESTIGTHETVFDKLKQFRADLHFEEITEDFLVDFFCYLKKTYENADSTAYKNMAILKKYVKLAVKAGYIEENPFEHFPIKDIESNQIYLEEHELNRLIQLYKDGNIDIISIAKKAKRVMY